MRDYRVLLVFAALAVPALVMVSLLVPDSTVRTVLSIVSVAPLLYLTLRLAHAVRGGVGYERRTFLQYRVVTEEFLTQVRALNQLAVEAQRKEAPPEIEGEIERVVERMHRIVDRLAGLAGRAG